MTGVGTGRLGAEKDETLIKGSSYLSGHCVTDSWKINMALTVQCNSSLLSAEDIFLPQTKVWLRFSFTLTPL